MMIDSSSRGGGGLLWGISIVKDANIKSNDDTGVNSATSFEGVERKRGIRDERYLDITIVRKQHIEALQINRISSTIYLTSSMFTAKSAVFAITPQQIAFKSFLRLETSLFVAASEAETIAININVRKKLCSSLTPPTIVLYSIVSSTHRRL